jgi:hypothetical protein
MQPFVQWEYGSVWVCGCVGKKRNGRRRPDLKLSLAWIVESSISLAHGTFEAVLDKVHEIVSFVSVYDKVHDAGGDSTIP